MWKKYENIQANDTFAGMGRFREAVLVLEEGLKMDPFSAALKRHLDAATRGILAELLAGCRLPSYD